MFVAQIDRFLTKLGSFHSVRPYADEATSIDGTCIDRQELIHITPTEFVVLSY